MTRVERIAIKIAARFEHWLSYFWGRHRKPEVIEPYAGYATDDHLILQGRVHAYLTQTETRFGQSRLRNVRQMLGRFKTAEVANAEIEAEGVRARTAEEGHFKLHLPRKGRSGWVKVPVTLVRNGSVTPCTVFAAPAGASQIIISDIDDTIMKTGAYSLMRNLWTSFTGNALTRQVYPDAAVLLHQLHGDGQRPVYYVSSSPWNLFSFIDEVFERSSVVHGPMFLRDLGVSERGLITGGHGAHKSHAVDTILAANPGVEAILIGDTGQQDALIYADAIARHPERIAAVVLREPAPGRGRVDAAALERLEEAGVPLFHAPTFAGFGEAITARMNDATPRERSCLAWSVSAE